MKRILLAAVILAIGAAGFGALRNSTLRWQREAANGREALRAQKRQLAAARTELTRIGERVSDLKQNLRTQERTAGSPADAALAIAAGKGRLSPAQREQLLAELGFNWNTTGDYVVVSKETLSAISLDGIQKGKLTAAAADVLALTPEERDSINALTEAIGQSYQTWAAAHAQRTEPSGKVVAEYTLPADAEFSKALDSQFTSGVTAALGDERGDLLVQYSGSWMNDLGMSGENGTTMTIKRYDSGDESRLSLNLKTANGGSMSTDVAPYQPFPEAFLPLFPNGWTDVASREGFQLPKSFQEK